MVLHAVQSSREQYGTVPGGRGGGPFLLDATASLLVLRAASAVWSSAVQCSAVRCSTVWCSLLQCSIMGCSGDDEKQSSV